MAAKRKPARRATTSRARTTTARRSTSTARKTIRKKTVSRARTASRGQLGSRIALFAAKRMATRSSVIQSRKDAAILRATHEGCATCGGNGQIFTKDKNGVFTGSKPCPAVPTKTKVSKWAVYKAARFGADKRSGLVGCSCPCGWKQKPRFRDAKEATKALRTHEKAKHGGRSVGGTWYAQTPAATATSTDQKPAVSKVVTDSGLTDDQWLKKSKRLHPGKAIAAGKCWRCAGSGSLHLADGSHQILVVCPECTGTGKPAKQPS